MIPEARRKDIQIVIIKNHLFELKVIVILWDFNKNKTKILGNRICKSTESNRMFKGLVKFRKEIKRLTSDFLKLYINAKISRTSKIVKHVTSKA